MANRWVHVVGCLYVVFIYLGDIRFLHENYIHCFQMELQITPEKANQYVQYSQRHIGLKSRSSCPSDWVMVGSTINSENDHFECADFGSPTQEKVNRNSKTYMFGVSSAPCSGPKHEAKCWIATLRQAILARTPTTAHDGPSTY